MNIRYYFFLLIVFCFFACKGNKAEVDLLQKAEKQVDNVDSLSTILCQIRNPEQLPDCYLADYRRLYVITQCYSEINLPVKQLLSIPFQYYAKSNEYEKLFQTFMIAGIYSFQHGEKSQAISYLLQGLSIASSHKCNKYIIRFQTLLGELEMKNKNYIRAIGYYKTMTHLKCGVPLDKDVLYNLALCYAHIGQRDSTSYYMNQCTSLALKDHRLNEASNYLRNYADILYEWKDFSGAIRYQKKALECLSSKAINPNLYTSISLSYFSLGKVDSARIYIEKSKGVIKIEASSEDQLSIVSRKNVALAMELLINARERKHLSLYEIGNFNDSIVRSNQDKQKQYQERAAVQKGLEIDNLKLKMKAEKSFFILAILVLTIVLIILVSYHNIRNKERKLIEIEEKTVTLQALLEDVQRSSSQDAMDESFFKKVLLQQLGIIRLIATNPTTQNQELLQQIQQISNDGLDVDSLLVWQDLYIIIDSVYDNFYTKIGRYSPKILNEKEVQLCCLLKAGFTTKEASVVTQQSVRTIYQRKTTIRQKLQLGESADFINYISESCVD